MNLQIVIMVIVILCSGIIDRLRGDDFNIYSRTVEKAIYGYLVAVSLGHYGDWMTPLIVLGFGLGVSMGWGSVIGRLVDPNMWNNTYEKWQIGPLRDNLWLAATVRGALFATPFSPLAWYDPHLLWAVPAFAIAFPLSIYCSIIAIDEEYLGFGDMRWRMSEYLRGWVGVSLCYLFQYTFN